MAAGRVKLDNNIPREKINWFPTVDYSKCTGCRECFKFCSHKVFSWDKGKKQPIVANPYSCVLGCSNCSTNVCKQKALSHPTLKQLKEMMDKTLILLFCILFLTTTAYCQTKKKTEQTGKQAVKLSSTVTSGKLKPVPVKVTFIELGSVKCIPCKMMQPVMKEIENEYSDKGVKVVFHDVWTKEGQPYSMKYNIRAIPTQVFLDKNGKEYFRHEGFFPKDELIEVLKQQGIK